MTDDYDKNENTVNLTTREQEIVQEGRIDFTNDSQRRLWIKPVQVLSYCLSMFRASRTD